MKNRILLHLVIILAVALLNAHKSVAASPDKLYRPYPLHVSSLASTPIIRVPEDVPSLQNAIGLVPDGGIIEVASGIYNSPTGGWRINNLQKGFTIRAAAGAIVTLSGGGSSDILRFMNSELSRGRPVTFQNLVFANGRSQTEGIAGGVTLYYAQATFIDCLFRNNTSNVSTTVGGGIYVAESSEVFFYRTTWVDNISRVEGSRTKSKPRMGSKKSRCSISTATEPMSA